MKRLAICLCLGMTVLVSVGMPSGAQTGSSTTPYSFKGGANADGNEPTMLIQARDGDFYGITSYGGGTSGCFNDYLNTTTGQNADGCGTVFRTDSKGENYTRLYTFSGTTDGGIPSSLIQGPDGMIYGTTLMGGPEPASPLTCDQAGIPGPCCLDSSGAPSGCGTIFEFDPSQINLSQTPAVTPNILYTFTGGADGGSPGNLILGSIAATPKPQALVFGTTLTCQNCGFNSSTANQAGTVFSFQPSGSTPFSTVPTIASFPISNADLAFPNSLVQWDQNTLYGTAQLGGDTSCLPSNGPPFGCGGVFRIEISPAPSSLLDLCNFGDSNCSDALLIQAARVPQPLDTSSRLLPEIIVKQSGARFPTGGDGWPFTAVPAALATDSSGNIYGTTPAGCLPGTSSYPPYLPDPYCSADFPSGATAEVPSSIFQMAPPAESANTTPGTITVPYSFSGNGSTSSCNSGADDGGSLAGLIRATDGNLYGLSGYGFSTNSTGSEVFTVQQSCVKQYASLDSNFTPTWMIQGSDGNFYGTTETGGTNSAGAIFEVTPSSPLDPPVQLCWQTPCSGSQINSSSQITFGNTATLTWSVPNAFSLTSQQCYAFVEGSNASTAGAWTGLQVGSLSNNVYGGTASISPTAAGTYIYALTCGGIVSASASLQVVPPQLKFPTITLPTGAINQSYSGSVGAQASGGTTPYTFSLTSGNLPAGLSLNSSTGAITGTPNTPGLFNFSITVKDSENPAVPVTTGFAITVMGSALSVTLSAQPNTGLTYGQSTTLTATETPVEGIAQGYSWSIYDSSTALVTGALSNGTGSYTMTTSPLTVGQHTFTATYSSSQNYYPPGTSNTVTLSVAKATPSVTVWPTASAITFGQTLASSTLSGGTASVGGTFTWSTPTTAPGVGDYSGSVMFTPTDTTDYNTVTGTVTVTVNPAAGFTLAPSPMSISVAQGGSGTSTITVTGVGGYSGNVTLAAAGLPTGVTSSFAAGSGAGTQVLTITASTSAQVTSSPVTITVTGTSGILSAMTSISLSIIPQPSFAAGSGGTTSMTVVPGSTTGNTGTISIAGTNGFTGSVGLSCKVTTSLTNVSDLPSCSLNPASVTISGTAAQTSTLTVTTTAASSAENNEKDLFWPTGGTALALVVLIAVPRRRRNWLGMAGMFLLCLAIGSVGCGGGSGGGGQGGNGGNANPGTTAGTYTITVTGTSGSVSATVGTVTLTVQ